MSYLVGRKNKAGTFKVGATSKAQKAFLKLEKGDPSGFLKVRFVAKDQEVEVRPFEGKNKSKNSRTVRKKTDMEEGTLQSRPLSKTPGKVSS